MTGLSKKLLLCLCLCLGFSEPKAQYRIDQWTADDGLPQNSVNGIVQTSDGYLWLATVDGLARFDGARFTVFNKSNSPGIINNRFTALFEDAGGDLWAGTEASGLVRYHNGHFSNYRGGDGKRINWISSDAVGNPMILLKEADLFHFLDGELSPIAQQTNILKSIRVVRQQNSRIYCNNDLLGNFWGCFADGRRISFSPAEGLPEYRLRGAARDSGGNFWLLTSDNELVRFENGKTVRVYNEKNGLPKRPIDFVTGAKLSLVSWDGQDSLWLTDLTTMESELLLKTPAGLPAEPNDIYPPFAKDERVFDSFHISYQDAEGNIWFGTERGGLYRARKQTIKTFSRNEGLTDTNVYPIYEEPDGTLLIGTTRGLFRFQNGSFSPVESTENLYVQAIGKDSAGRVLISDYHDLYVRDDNRFVPFLKGRFPDLYLIYAIHTDLENQLWIGGEQGLVLYKDDAATKFTTSDGLAGNDVKVILDARAGGIWIGTYGGLTLYKDGKFTSWTESDGLLGDTVRALYEEPDGTLWIGSYDGGLARFKYGKFTQYNTKIGLYNDGAFQILEDERRNFWISSNHGIYRVSKDELNDFAAGKRSAITSTAYDKSDGMLNQEANGGRSPAGVKTRDGRLWFPTQDGVAMVDPGEIRINSQPPPVVIESLKIDNELLELPGLARDSEMVIKPSQQNFEINYTALSFINSENLRFKYRLEGLEEEWIDAGTRRLAYFSYVPPGEYTFRVIAANSDNVWNEQGAALKIVVLPPFYRTWWFFILVIFAIVAASFLLFRRRITQIKLKHAAELAFSRRLIDSQEQERKRFAAEMHDGLGQSLVIIKNRARLSLRQADPTEAMIGHLENISETASQAIQEAKEIAFNLRPHLLDRLGLTKTIESMLGKVFSASGIEFEAEIDIIDGVLEKESEILLYRIVQECANNIVKHSQAGKAFLKIERDERILTVKISDDGRGFDPSASKNDLSKRSFGLIGIGERTRLLGGKLNLESAIGKGTFVSITINL